MVKNLILTRLMRCRKGKLPLEDPQPSVTVDFQIVKELLLSNPPVFVCWKTTGDIIVFYFKTFEIFKTLGKQRFECRDKQRLAKSSWARQENRRI